jgi:hypothetical protein
VTPKSGHAGVVRIYLPIESTAVQE